jgi:hypothetical protein
MQEIANATCAFDVGIPALKALKDAGISDVVVGAMLQRRNQ